MRKFIPNSLKKLSIAALLALLLVSSISFLPRVAEAARTDALWDYLAGGNYTQPNGSAAGTNILIYGLNHYLNFGTITGVNGYGIRDNAGTIECKNSGGSWGTCGGGGGGTGTVTQIDTTWPILGGPITTTGTLTFGGLSTSTNGVIGNIPYFSGVNTFANVATTSLSISGPFSIPSTLSLLGSGGVTYWGLATTSQPASSNVLVSNGAAGVYGVATSTATCTSASGVSCTSFSFLGSGEALSRFQLFRILLLLTQRFQVLH
jgi:hypothetical protein